MLRHSIRATLLIVTTFFVASVSARGDSASSAPEPSTIGRTIAGVQPKIVKLYGAGGLRGLEGYQTGLLISSQGHVLTAWSYVLDSDSVTAILSDGRRFEARLLGADPRLEVAVLKVDGSDLQHFDLAKAVAAEPGTRVLAFSNLFGVATGNELPSVQRGTVAALTRLEARRGVFETPYRGPVYVLDVVTNNPGAAGGALVTRRGDLLGIARQGAPQRPEQHLAQLRDSHRPASATRSIRSARASSRGSPTKPPRSPPRADSGDARDRAGADVVDRTPPYVDRIVPGSQAAKAGVGPDDLVIFVDGRLVQSCKALREELQYVDYEDKVKLTVLRGQEMREFELQGEVGSAGEGK